MTDQKITTNTPKPAPRPTPKPPEKPKQEKNPLAGWGSVRKNPQ
jgi:hypothetical protein